MPSARRPSNNPQSLTPQILGPKVIGKAATMDTRLVQAAHKLLGPLMLRRLKREVQQDLPPKRTLVVWCPLSSMQRFWYKR